MLLDIVKHLEGHADTDRFEKICLILEELGVDYSVQEYSTGKNIIVKSSAEKWVGVSSHFDAVPQCPGANDNASAVAVCISIIEKLIGNPLQNIGVSIFFFDEEEYGLKGSKAYITKFGIEGIIGLINLEMVGQGDKIAFWSLNEKSKGTVLETMESVALKEGVYTTRFDKMVTLFADHMNFMRAGLTDAFSLTSISNKDIEVAYHYYKAQEFDVDHQTLKEIMQDAPVFQHYHQATDVSDFLSEDSLQMVSNVIWKTLLALDKGEG